MDISTYDFKGAYHCYECRMKELEDGTGDFVRAEDYDKLRAEVERLRDTSLKALGEMKLYFDQYPHMKKGYIVDVIEELQKALEGEE